VLIIRGKNDMREGKMAVSDLNKFIDNFLISLNSTLARIAGYGSIGILNRIE